MQINLLKYFIFTVTGLISMGICSGMTLRDPTIQQTYQPATSSISTLVVNGTIVNPARQTAIINGNFYSPHDHINNQYEVIDITKEKVTIKELQTGVVLQLPVFTNVLSPGTTK